MAVREKAKSLYTTGECGSYEDVAAALKELFPAPTPSRTQIQRWAQAEGWRNKKDQLRQDLMDLEEGSIEFRKRLMKKALEVLKDLEDKEKQLDSQSMFGLVRVAKVISPKETSRQEEAPAPDIDRPALFLEDLEFIANILKEVDPEGLKVFARNFEVIAARGKAQYAQTA